MPNLSKTHRPALRYESAMSGTYASIVRGYQRRFRHQVRLRNAYWWRSAHVAHQIRHLRYGKEYGQWHEGDQARGAYFGICGFICAAQAGCLEGWAADCGIDWSIPPEEQMERPPAPPERNWTENLPPTTHRCENLHSVAMSAGLGITCSACNRRAVLTPQAIGAHSGSMREVSSLRLTCKVCGSRKWQHKALRTASCAAEFLAGTY